MNAPDSPPPLRLGLLIQRRRAGFALVGTFFIFYGSYRQRAVERALDHGTFASPDPRLVAVVTACGVVLGLLTLVLVITTS